MPDFLAVGHITQDLTPWGYTVGGTVTFAALTAHRLGYSAAILTRASDDLVLPPELDGIEFHRLPSAETTTFENIYRDGRREQFLHARASDLRPGDLPAALCDTPNVLLGPLARELDPAFVHAFPSSTQLGVTPQGWLRQWDAQGRVTVRPWHEAAEILPYVSALILSDQDIQGLEKLLDSYIAMAALIALTHGSRGATLYARGRAPIESPAFPAVEVDPTGAGDVFAAALLLRLAETSDLAEAAHFANCVASFSIEAPGISGIPTRARVDERLALWK